MLLRSSLRRPPTRLLLARAGRRASSSFWSSQPNVPPELAALLNDGVGRGVGARSELAATLAASWRAELVGEPRPAPGGGTSLAYTLRAGASPTQGADVAVLRAAIFPADQAGDVATGLLFAPQCHPALPLNLASAPLIEAAVAGVRERGADRVAAVAALPGLCAWIVEQQAWEGRGFDDEQAGAVVAVARGEPRPGHSVLGEGTFKAAQTALEALALEYASRHGADTECTAFAEAGASLQGIHYMHETSPDALRDSAGCTASFEFPPAS